MKRWYLLLPVVVLFTSIAGGFDVVAAWLILLAYVLFVRGQSSWSAVAIGVAGALRIYPFILVPVYLIHIWKSSPRQGRTVTLYVILSLLPLILSCLPFVLDDWLGLMNTLRTQQTFFGPFATLNFVAIIVYFFTLLSQQGFNIQTLGYVFAGMTLLALASVYIWLSVRSVSKVSPLNDSLLVLLVFFLLYPKVHGLYLVVILPLALISSARIARWVWLPGTCWMLLVNGAYGAVGLGYWLAPTTGEWVSWVSTIQAAYITAFLSGVQALLIIWAIIDLMCNSDRKIRRAHGRRWMPNVMRAGEKYEEQIVIGRSVLL